MKRKALALALTATVAIGMFAGCGAKKTETASTSAPAKEAATAEETKEAAPAQDTSKGSAAKYSSVLNISCWNDEFQRRIQDHYPGYEKIDSNSGKIGDVLVKWNITPNDNNAYQNKLDEDLIAQVDGKKTGDDMVDMFLIEADYAQKYVGADVTMPLKDLGITDADLSEQFQYTKDAMTDANGALKGVSWQGCPGLLVYNRALAKEVLGSDDPAEVQKAVADWSAFQETAKKVAEKGYFMTSSVNDSYRVFSNNVTSKWVNDKNQINIDKNIEEWAKMSKTMVDAKQTRTFTMWSDDWKKGFFKQDTAPNGNVFCYFGPAWFIDFSMSAGEDGAIATDGGWGACKGPQGFFWGGTWICAAAGTDNADLIKNIMLTMTTDKDVLKEIVVADNDFVNNKSIMEEFAKDTNYSSLVLGGQNAIQMYLDGITSIDLKYTSIYDQACNEEFQNCMKNYFDGQCSYEEALALFDKAVHEKHPDLQ